MQSTRWSILTNDASLELSEEERASIFAAPEFLDFVEQSSKIVQRALNDGYDYIRDYTVGTEAGGYALSYFHWGKINSFDSEMIQRDASNAFASSMMNVMERTGQSRTLIGRQKYAIS